MPPMKKRTAARPVPLEIRPLSASGIEKNMTRKACEKRGPIVSAHAPTSRRMPMVPATEMVFAVPMALRQRALQMHSRGVLKSSQPPFSQRPSETRTTGVSGASANQPVNARKKESQAKWKARMCGREKSQSTILSARDEGGAAWGRRW
jgi:hypothetical protein